MNPSEQREHKSRMDDLAASYINFANATDERAKKIEGSISAAVGVERTARLRLATEQRLYVDTQDAKNSRALEAHAGLTFLGRLRWLALGSRESDAR